MSKLDDFKALMNTIPNGDVTCTNLEQLQRGLAECWHELKGSADGGMEGYKLRNRTEDTKWQAPILTFTLERHGPTVMGSVYADLQEWTVDLNSGSASYREGSKRQVQPKNPQLKVRPIAAEIAKLIKQNKNDPRLVWKSTSEVRIKIGEIIPDICPKLTLSGRRKRFRAAFDEELKQIGWSMVNNQTAIEDKSAKPDISPVCQ